MGADTGEPAPDFTLPGTGGRDYSLSEYQGRPVVLAFYPGDDSMVCTQQLCRYNDDMAEFAALDAQVLGISPQSVDSHERFAAKHGYTFPLLADVDKAVAKAYGSLGLFGMYRRSVFVVDKEGIVRYAHRSLTGMVYRPTAELVEAIRACG